MHTSKQFVVKEESQEKTILMTILNLIHTFSAVPITIPADIFLVEIDKLTLKLYGI